MENEVKKYLMTGVALIAMMAGPALARTPAGAEALDECDITSFVPIMSKDGKRTLYWNAHCTGDTGGGAAYLRADVDPIDPGDDVDPIDPGDDVDPIDPGDDVDPIDPGDDGDDGDDGNHCRGNCGNGNGNGGGNGTGNEGHGHDHNDD